ncbi:hypothetical protein HELRODRAFT_174648 [Helobdella robusta]|uniref:Fibrinogen C-terminal domain-containing protein n=1 Tax=Helobdella robusta TaxID=6412 RepID=T1F8C6_HELRO|nr:hypothetical protein HELRODRAFT_174648 [Helobdella robusta]ESO01684.1 hypothetical protein HELRODRAFT_174648 [Helobdella robusta]
MFFAILLVIISSSSSVNAITAAVDKKYGMIGEPDNPMCFASEPSTVLTNIRSSLECSSKCSHYVSPTDGNITCNAFNYVSNNASHPPKYCQLFHFTCDVHHKIVLNKTHCRGYKARTNITILTLSKSCNFTFTFNGGLFYSCSNSLPGIKNPCALYMCLTADRQLSICLDPHGFGTYYKNFWLGLEKMHQLTTSADYRLKFEVLIKISSELEKYSLHVSEYSGDGFDVLNAPLQNGMKFSTPDQDNDHQLRFDLLIWKLV